MLLFPYLVFSEVHWIDWVLVYSFKFAKLLELFLQIFFLFFVFSPLFKGSQLLASWAAQDCP